MRLAKRAGIDSKIAMEVLLSSVVASPMLKYRAPFMLNRPDKAWFTIDLSVKDLKLTLDAARELGVELAATRTAAETFMRAVREGRGSQEVAAIYDVVEAMDEPARIR
jgi:3-hydroxyisobutyrate dehydrogenase-like beta-hydroxyacid dehydrogenase